jgi:hypothetical protein
MGLGCKQALLLATHGAKMVVNDIGANMDGTGNQHSFAAHHDFYLVKRPWSNLTSSRCGMRTSSCLTQLPSLSIRT